MFFLLISLLLFQQHQAEGIKCAVCSHFPKPMDSLKLEQDARNKIEEARKMKLNVVQREIVNSFENAIDNTNHHLCFANSSTQEQECPDSLDTCIRQIIVANDKEIKTPAIIYSCSKWQKTGCIKSVQDGTSKWQMCACNDKDGCSSMKPYEIILKDDDDDDSEHSSTLQKIVFGFFAIFIIIVKILASLCV